MTFPNQGALAQRFDVRRELGRGGFARVYEVLDRHTGHVVALKLLEPDLGDAYDPQTRARFRREVEILRQLQSPYTVRLLDHGEVDGRLFAVFELIRGEDLSQLLRQRGTLSVDDVVHILRQILMSLSEAHDQGLVHRDLKPENVRIVATNTDALQLKVLDFGIARSVERAAGVTKTGEAIGTPRYMSPEQLKSQQLTPASDVYSVGMLAFELLLGRDALPGNRWADQIDRARTGHLFSAPQLEQLGPLYNIIQRMTAQDAAARYRAARDVLHALDNPGHVAPLPTPGSQSSSTSQTAIGLSLLVLFGLIAILILRDEEPREPTPTPARSLESLLAPTKSNREPALPVVVDSGHSSVDSGHSAVDTSTPEPADPPKPSAGCREPADTFDDTTAVHEPDDADGSTPLPLVILLHSDHNSPEYALETSGLPRVADREGFYIAAPSGSAPGVPKVLQTAFHSWREGDHVDQKIIDTYESARQSLCIDEHRVFIVGSGDGGRRLHKFYDRSWVRAVALSSYLENADYTDKPSQVPSLWLLPRDSKLLPLDGSGSQCQSDRPEKQTLESLTNEWKQANRCRGRPKTDDSLGECSAWTCEVPFEVCVIPGGIGWPGENRNPIATQCGEAENVQLPYAEKIWDFLISSPPRKQ